MYNKRRLSLEKHDSRHLFLVCLGAGGWEVLYNVKGRYVQRVHGYHNLSRLAIRSFLVAVRWIYTFMQ